ncbi:MAG: PAS domain-containing protein [Myxococcales bacterium]|nr:PAS domain-containing protein [Myxococcales bacterium]
MSLGIRGRLFLVSVALILSVSTTSAVYLEFELRRWLEGRMETELAGQATLALAALQLAAPEHSVTAFDALADRLGKASGSRISIIDRDGTVLGDSSLTPAQIARVENHANRPELRALRDKPRGVARRRSATLDTEMIYVAVPLDDPAIHGALRLATPMSAIDEAVDRMRLMLLVASGLGLLLAIGMSLLASHLLSRRLRALLSRARAIAEGHAIDELAHETRDEIAGLDRSLARLDEALEEVVDTLARERDRFEAVLEGMEEAVIAVDGEERVTLINHAGQQLLGLDEPPLEERLGDHVSNARIRDALTKALAGQATTLQIELDEPTGSRHLLVRVTPQRAEAGAVVVLHDVTRLRRLETMRRDFVANVSHELRTPVSIIRLNAETLRDGALDDPKSAPRFIDALLRNAERLSDLVSDLLDISRIESGKYPMQPELILVERIAARTVSELEQLATERRTRVSVDVPSALRVRADEKALEQVLINLLQNAVKYTPEEGHVWVVARPAGDRVRIEVRDDGPGIPPEHRGRIFERFYRVDAGRSKHMGGTGLGLSIVKHLVANMDGTVGVESNEPRGSVFWVDLPGEHAAALDSAAGNVGSDAVSHLLE